MPDETPFDWVEWFGEDWYYLKAPLARLQTTEYCPEQVLNEFAREDHEVGFVDYDPADWLAVEDQARIEARLHQLGYDVVHDSSLLDGYMY